MEIFIFSGVLYLLNMDYFARFFNSSINYVYGSESTNKDRGDDDVQRESDKVRKYKYLESSTYDFGMPDYLSFGDFTYKFGIDGDLRSNRRIY